MAVNGSKTEHLIHTLQNCSLTLKSVIMYDVHWKCAAAAQRFFSKQCVSQFILISQGKHDCASKMNFMKHIMQSTQSLMEPSLDLLSKDKI